MQYRAATGKTSVKRDGDVWVIELTGEQDLSTAVEFNATLDSLVSPEELPISRPALVVIDLAKTTFLDSAVIAVLLRAHDLAEIDRDMRLALVVESAESPVGRILRLVGVTRSMPTYTSRRAAASAVSEGSLSITENREGD
jgi:anti-anti-sigma factor